MAGLTLVSNNGVSNYAPLNQTQAAVQNDAYELLQLIEGRFAYRDRFPNQYIPTRQEIDWRIPYLATRNDLIHFAQSAFHTLYDHHSITCSALYDDPALVPSYADLWVERKLNGYEIIDVRKGSPAAMVGIRPGYLITHIDGWQIDQAVANFIGMYPVVLNAERQSYAARILAAGHRNRMRRISLYNDGLYWTVELPTLYGARLRRDPGLLSVQSRYVNGRVIGIVRFNDSLGDPRTIGAFDQALNELGPVDGLILDLRDTASGGTTQIARGILGRFVSEPVAYQRHVLPGEEACTGIVRSWLEEVHPRSWRVNMPLAAVSGRWTASMGEGLTVALDALGAATFGTQMAGLLGGVSDHELPHTGIMVKLTTEKLQHIDGTPRENYRPRQFFNYADAPGENGIDGPMKAAIDYLSSHTATTFR